MSTFRIASLRRTGRPSLETLESRLVFSSVITAGLPGPVRTGAYGGAVGARKTLEVSKSIPLNPLANTSVDPLDNTLGTQLADFRAVNTGTLTGPLSRGASLDDLPVVGPLTNTVTESLPR